MSANYRILTFGGSLPDAVTEVISQSVGQFDLHLGEEIEIIRGEEALNAPVATVAIFVGQHPFPEFDAKWVLEAGIPLIPIASTTSNFSKEIPDTLQHLNAFFLSNLNSSNVVSAAVLENLHLLPQQRRVFMSYVRNEATEVALQLFADLESRQFRVFIDTHGVRPGARFQEELWHQLCDCDVMVMLDTQDYFERQWTREEFGKANLKKAAILRVAFPDVLRDESLSISETVILKSDDFVDSHRLLPAAVDRIGDTIEGLRSQSVAMRHISLVSALRAAVESISGKMLHPGPMRRIEIELPRGKRIYAYPAVGVPSAPLLHEVADHAGSRPAAIVYDHLGIREQWIDHLRWLGAHVPEVRWIQSLEAAWDLTRWDAEP